MLYLTIEREGNEGKGKREKQSINKQVFLLFPATQIPGIFLYIIIVHLKFLILWGDYNFLNSDCLKFSEKYIWYWWSYTLATKEDIDKRTSGHRKLYLWMIEEGRSMTENST